MLASHTINCAAALVLWYGGHLVADGPAGGGPMSAWLTSLYDASPATLKRLFMNGYALYLHRLREGAPMVSAMETIDRIDRADRDAIADYQLRRINDLLTWVEESVPFYSGRALVGNTCDIDVAPRSVECGDPGSVSSRIDPRDSAHQTQRRSPRRPESEIDRAAAVRRNRRVDEDGPIIGGGVGLIVPDAIKGELAAGRRRGGIRIIAPVDGAANSRKVDPAARCKPRCVAGHPVVRRQDVVGRLGPDQCAVSGAASLHLESGLGLDGDDNGVSRSHQH